MEAEQLLELMDSCWFQRRIFQYKHESPSLTAKIPHHRDEDKAVINYRAKNLQIRSHSDRCIGAVDLEADSPTSVIIKPKLQKIPEPCHARREKREKQRIKKRDSRRERGLSRSLSALESQELKGFRDLGFVFDDKEETNPDLASIIPGLQKRGKLAAAAAGGGDGVEVSRPYLSEAWGSHLNWRRKDGKDIFMNWKLKSHVKNEMDMKDHLKIWAHVVASTVR